MVRLPCQSHRLGRRGWGLGLSVSSFPSRGPRSSDLALECCTVASARTRVRDRNELKPVDHTMFGVFDGSPQSGLDSRTFFSTQTVGVFA